MVIEAMEIRIINTPKGEAPLWVRQAWIGVQLPLAYERLFNWSSWGVLTGPKTFAAKFWFRVTKRAEKVSGYAVYSPVAVELLSQKDPAAAEWWETNAPNVLLDGQTFVFDKDACEVLRSA